MQEYREKLKLQNLLIALGGITLDVVFILGALGRLRPAVGNREWQDAWQGFIMGATLGINILMLVVLIRNILALCSEKFLKKFYVENKDERTADIFLHARATAMQICLLMGVPAVVIAGYFSMTVSLTLLAGILVESFLALGLKIYFAHKF